MTDTELFNGHLLPGNDDLELLTFLEGKLKTCRQDRIQFERQWLMNLAFYFGRQNVQWVGTGTGVLNGYDRLIEPPVPPWRVRLVINKIRVIVRTELSKLTKENPRAFVVPASTEDKDLAAARAGEAIYEYLHRTLELRKIIRRAEFWTVICGSGFIKDWYDPSVPDSSGNVGQIFTEAVSPFHFYVPDVEEEELEKQPFVIHELGKDPNWVKDKFGIEVQADSRSASNDMRFLSSLGITKQKSNSHVAVREIWLKPNSEYPNGLVATWAGDQILAKTEEWPFSHGQFPFTRLDAIPTGRFYADSIVTDLIPLQKEYNRCYDEKTEILTQSGWKRGAELSVGENVLTFDSKTRSMKFSPVKEMFLKNYSGPMTVLENRQISARTTPGHKWFVKSSEGKWKSVTKLTSDHSIPLSAPVEIEGDDNYNLHKLVGLVLTDGRIDDGGRVLISQSEKVNGRKCDEIESLLNDEFIPFSLYHCSNDIVDFYIPVSHSWKIKQLIPNKRLTPEYIMTLGHKGLKGLFDGMMLGDGMYDGGRGALFYTSLKVEADLFHMVCALLGMPAVVRRQKARSHWSVRPYQYIVQVKTEKFSKARVFRAKKSDEHYEGTIWCPTVDTGFVYVRRNGRAYISGNTRSQIVEAKNRMAKPQLLAPRGSIDPTKVTTEPGLIIQYTPGFAEPKPLPLQNLPSYVLQEIDRIQTDMNDLSSQHEVTRGQTPPGVSAATAISYLQEADDSKLKYAVDSLEEGIEKIGRHLLSHVKDFWMAERTIQVIGLNGAWEAFEFSNSNIAGNTDLRIEAGSAEPTSRSAKQAFIMELGKMGWVPPTRALKYLDMAETGRLYEEMQVDARHAQRENLRILAGEQVLVNDYDNHEAHLIEHNNFCKTQEFENSPDEAKQIMLQHRMVHRMQIAQAMGGMISPGSPLPGGDPSSSGNLPQQGEQQALPPGQAQQMGPQ